jgi:hypothetical protein
LRNRKTAIVWFQMMQCDATGWHWICLNPRDVGGVQSKVGGLEITKFKKCRNLCLLHVPLGKRCTRVRTTHADPCSTISRSQQSWCLALKVLERGRTNWDDLEEQRQCTGGRLASRWHGTMTTDIYLVALAFGE